MYLRRRNRVRQEGERRNTFLRYLGEVAGAVSEINGVDRQHLYDQLVKVAKKQTSEADVRYDDRGERVEEVSADFGENVLIVQPEDQLAGINRVKKDASEEDSAEPTVKTKKKKESSVKAKPSKKAKPKVRPKPKASAARPRRPKAKRSSR